MAANSVSEHFWSEKHIEIEQLVVAGKHDQARLVLGAINPKTIPRHWVASFAQLSLRFRESLHALKLLHSIIRPENSFDKPANSQEKVAYAYALTNLGAVDEALEILADIDTENEPEVLFQRGMALFKKWNYEEAIPLLLEFIKSKRIDPYRRLVGQLNLAAAYVCTEDWSNARPLLNEIQIICEANNYNLLNGNCSELQAQVHLFNQEYDRALECLSHSLTYLKNEIGVYSLLARKWEAICHCYISSTEDNLQKLYDIRKQAIELSHWETVRECDLFEARFTNNENLLRKVIMGSPSEYYRKRARKIFGSQMKAVGSYVLFVPGIESEKSNVQIFDPYKKDSASQGLFEFPYLLYLYEALSQDFYKPSHLGLLFRGLYPEEKFNPFTSPARVLRLLKRLDKWFQQAHLPLRVKFKNSEFQIVSQQSITILVQRGFAKAPQDAHLFALKEKFGDKPFSSSIAASSLGISKTKTLKLLKNAFEKGKLKFFSQGRESRYQFSKQKSTGEKAA